jgi:hypothetical protein
MIDALMALAGEDRVWKGRKGTFFHANFCQPTSRALIADGMLCQHYRFYHGGDSPMTAPCRAGLQSFRRGFVKLRIITAILMLTTVLVANPILLTFEFWGVSDHTSKLHLYLGWTNGFTQARGEGALELLACLDRMSSDQAIAMVDKYYKDHPERWARPFGDEILQALTVDGGPCEGKNAWRRN